MSSSAVSLRQQGWSTRALRSSDDFWYVLKILAAFVTLTLVLLALKPDLLRPFFPATACFAGYWIYRRNESYYLSFMLWIFMLTPLLRRVVDWRTSYQTQSLILLAPLLITLLPAIQLRRRLVMVIPVIRTGALLTLSGIVFGAGVGMIKHPGVNVILAAVMWSAPIVLCVFAASIRERAMLGRVLTRTFLWGVLLMSVYGTYQYLVAPHWDAYWLTQVTLESFSPSYGHPEPMGIRVWSTMNSPGSFSLFLGAALVWLCTVDGLLAILACGMGYITLSLTLVRTAWIMTIIGILIYVLGCRTRPSLRSITTALLTVGLVAYVLVHATQFAGVFDRLQTFSSLSADGSVHVRMEMYHHMNDYILSAPFGLGLESPAVISRFYLDSSFVEVFVMLGWLGALCYLSGFAYLILHIVLSLRSFSRERVAAAAITLACATQIFSGNAFYQQGGTVLWLFIGVWASLSRPYALPTDQPRISASYRTSA